MTRFREHDIIKLKEGIVMQINLIMKSIMAIRGFTFRTLATKMGKSSHSTLANQLSRPNGMRVDKLLEMLDAMDCELVIRSKLSDKKEWTVTKDDKVK